MARHTLRYALVTEHAGVFLFALLQVVILLGLVFSGLWRTFATALNAFPSGLGMKFTYRPDRSLRPPAYEALRTIGALGDGLGRGARGVSNVTGAHQRAAFRVHGYLLERRSSNHDDR